MVGLPTETLSDIYELADLCIQTHMNRVQCNMYGVAPKYPLNSLPQLSPQLREYHLRLFVKLLKQKKIDSLDKDVLFVMYEKKLKRGSRTKAREKIYAEYWFKETCMYSWDMTEDVFIPLLNRFAKSNDNIKKYLPYLRNKYLNNLKN